MATYRAILQLPLQMLDYVITVNGAVRALQGFDEITGGGPLEYRHSIVKDPNTLLKTNCFQKELVGG